MAEEQQKIILTKQEEEEYREAFRMFDEDNSGQINAEELGHVLRSLGENPVQAEIKDIINSIDKNGSGQIDFEEFAQFMAKKRAQINPEEEIKGLFDMFDQDKTQLITSKGIQFVMRMLNEDITEEEAQYMIKVASGDIKGITFEEFRKVMSS